MQVFSEEKESLTVRLVEGSQPLKFTVSKADEVVKEIGTVLSRWQNQQPVRGGGFTYIFKSCYSTYTVYVHYDNK